MTTTATPPVAPPVKYRLVYFDVRALGEPIRWIFKYSKTPFIDERIPWDYPRWFAETKKNYLSTVGQVPILYETGKPHELSQSQVISRYLARKFGLTGDNEWEEARVDEVISLVFDLFIYWRMMVIFERDPERKKANRVLIDQRFQLYYGKWNRILEESGGPYILGGKLTHADFWVASFVAIWDDPMVGDEPVMPAGFSRIVQEDMYLDFTKGFPALRAHKERVHGIKEIGEWIKERHATIA